MNVDDDRTSPTTARQRLGLALGPVLLLVALLVPAPGGMDPAAWRTTAVGLLMAVWWVTEAVPLAATALLPLVLLPPLGVVPIGEAASPYANPIIFLFLGGFLIALAMERWGLHRRLALVVVRAIGTSPRMLVLGFMVATAFLSMWVSNTATAIMMLPIGVSVIRLIQAGMDEAGAGDGLSEGDRVGGEARAAADPAPVSSHFAIALMLGVAYAASIGGLGTLIGTPPNALLAGFMLESYGLEIGFARWMGLGVPLVVLTLPLGWLLLTRVAYPIRIREIPGGRAAIEREYRQLGRVTAPERAVAAVFVATALLWMTRPLLEGLVPGLSDAGIAIAAAVALFILPAGAGRGALMDWQTAETLPWGVLILFGGGLSLANAIRVSGLDHVIGEAVGGLALPTVAMVVAVVAVIILLTELTSNTATAAAFLPLVAGVALGLGENPLLLAVPAALGASCAFMMPVATPPNAIVYGSGYITVPQMARAGLWLNVLFVVAITTLAYALLPVLFGVQVGVVPAWAG